MARYISRVKNIAYTLVLVAVVVFGQSVRAQKSDSLLTVLKEHPFDDTTRVILLSRLAGLYQFSFPDSMMMFANQGLELSEKINFEKGKAIAKSQIGTVDLIKNDYDKALIVYNEALQIYGKINYPKGVSASYHNIGNTYYSQMKFGLAVENYNAAMQISEKTHDLKSVGLEYSNIGNIYKDLGDYSKATQNYLDGLKILENEKDSADIATCLTSIGTMYGAMGEYKKALDNMYRSLDIDKITGNIQSRLYNIVNIGVTYGEMKDYKGALVALNEALLLADTLKDDYWKVTCKGNIAEAYFYLGDYDQALEKYNEALREAEKINETFTVALAENGIGKIFINKGQIREGISHLLASYNMAKNMKIKDQMFEIARSLSEAYEKDHDYQHALEYHKIYFDLRDSLFSEKNDKKIQQLQFDYELGKKENKIELLEKNKVIEHDRVEKQRVMLWALVSGLALLVLIILLLFRSRAYEKRSKENIMRQKEEIHQQAIKLEELNRFKDKTFSVLSHDLRRPLQALSATMDMMDENIISPEEFADLRPEMNSQLGAVNILLENLLNWAKGYIQGQTNAQPVNTSLNDIARQTTRLVRGIADKKQIAIQNNIPESTFVCCDPSQLDIVIRNLIMNAAKFTNHNGTITIAASNQADKVKISITDTGVGMTPEQLAKLFTPVAGNNTYGTDGETGTGLGLLLCYEFIKANDGTIAVNSDVGKGSTFTIILPGPRQRPNVQ